MIVLFPDEPAQGAANLGDRVLYVTNVRDSARPAQGTHQTPDGHERMEVNALTGDGVDDLRGWVRAAALAGPRGQSAVMAAETLTGVSAAIRRAEEEIGRGELELIAVDLREAAQGLALACGLGRTPSGYSEAVLDRIFARFCIGK